TRSADTTTTPAASPTTTSPGVTTAVATVTEVLTDAGLSLTVPRAWLAAANAGTSIFCSSAISRTPPSITRPTPPRARKEVANKSPKKPASDVVVQAATTTSPSCNCSAATCIIQLSPGCSRTVTAGPQSLAPA